MALGGRERGDCVGDTEGRLTARADVALVTVQQAVPDPHVRPRGGVAQLSLTHPTLENRNNIR